MAMLAPRVSPAVQALRQRAAAREAAAAAPTVWRTPLAPSHREQFLFVDPFHLVLDRRAPSSKAITRLPLTMQTLSRGEEQEEGADEDEKQVTLARRLIVSPDKPMLRLSVDAGAIASRMGSGPLLRRPLLRLHPSVLNAHAHTRGVAVHLRNLPLAIVPAEVLERRTRVFGLNVADDCIVVTLGGALRGLAPHACAVDYTDEGLDGMPAVDLFGFGHAETLGGRAVRDAVEIARVQHAKRVDILETEYELTKQNAAHTLEWQRVKSLWLLATILLELHKALVLAHLPTPRLFVLAPTDATEFDCVLLTLLLTLLSSTYFDGPRGEKPHFGLWDALAVVNGVFRALLLRNPSLEHKACFDAFALRDAITCNMLSMRNVNNDGWNPLGYGRRGTGSKLGIKAAKEESACYCSLPESYIAQHACFWPDAPAPTHVAPAIAEEDEEEDAMDLTRDDDDDGEGDRLPVVKLESPLAAAVASLPPLPEEKEEEGGTEPQQLPAFSLSPAMDAAAEPLPSLPSLPASPQVGGRSLLDFSPSFLAMADTPPLSWLPPPQTPVRTYSVRLPPPAAAAAGSIFLAGSLSPAPHRGLVQHLSVSLPESVQPPPPHPSVIEASFVRPRTPPPLPPPERASTGDSLSSGSKRPRSPSPPPSHEEEDDEGDFLANMRATLQAVKPVTKVQRRGLQQLAAIGRVAKEVGIGCQFQWD